MALTSKQVQNVCMANGKSPSCKYLDMVYDKSGVHYVCTKLAPAAFVALEKRRKASANGYSGWVWGQKPTGDHCKGYPLLVLTPQGYDI